MPKVTFAVQRDWQDVVQPPTPARLAPMPEWWKRLPARVAPQPGRFQIGTVKVCAPFYDAMVAGYIVPLPIPLSVAFDPEGVPTFAWRGAVGANLVVPDHSAEQLDAGVDEQGTIFKFISPWMIRTPKGYSSLFVPPLNRPDLPYEVFSGVVETDNYRSTVQFPFRWRGPREPVTLDGGTPLVQVIPFRREDWGHQIAGLTREELATWMKPTLASTALLNGYRRLFHVTKIWR